MEPLSRRAVLKGRRNDVTMISEEEEAAGAILGTDMTLAFCELSHV
jgi:hypothetical protein